MRNIAAKKGESILLIGMNLITVISNLITTNLIPYNNYVLTDSVSKN